MRDWEDRKVPQDVIGPIYGWRVWTLTVSPFALSYQLNSRAASYRWAKKDQEAQCLRTGMSTPRVQSDHKPGTHHYCWCGLYAHATLRQCVKCFESRLSPQTWKSVAYRLEDDDKDFGYLPDARPLGFRSVLGLVSATGTVFDGDLGFRAEKMSIDTLMCVHENNPPKRGLLQYLINPTNHQPAVPEVGRSLGVPVMCTTRDLRVIADLFADREQVPIWKKGKTWTSDDPYRSSKSTTSTKGGVRYPTLGDRFAMKINGKTSSPANFVSRSRNGGLSLPSSLSEDDDE